jgi:hypothetical protein
MEPTIETKKGNGVVWGIIGLIVIVAAAFGIMKYGKSEETGQVSGNNSTSTPIAPSENTLVYKNGTYTATGNYVSPGGSETINITLVIENDMVVDATAVPQATRPISVTMQNAFSSNFKALIVGKKVDEVSLDKVSGSSLTPKGFNDAIIKIKAQAKA